LERDDYQVQSAEFVSPPKWHLAHTTWFFETFILNRFIPEYASLEPRYGEIFNSYYRSFGKFHERPRRGNLSRPTLEAVLAYRTHVDAAITELVNIFPEDAEIARLIELGINHEEQHQELLFMDIQHIFYMNPLRPVYRVTSSPPVTLESKIGWIEIPQGLHRIGATEEIFAFDNERPAHDVQIGSVAIASRPITNAEYLEFMADGGYDDPLIWLAEGWDIAKAESWRAPLYWESDGSSWWHFSLGGMTQIDPHAPVSHVSYYEALAFAHWRGQRLATEYEWEVAAQKCDLKCGSVWEWTQSPYTPYPGYRVVRDALGEYNGKFMVNQMTLKGGSQYTPPGHGRPTYRNFYHPQMRWQFAGIRLLEDR